MKIADMKPSVVHRLSGGAEPEAVPQIVQQTVSAQQPDQKKRDARLSALYERRRRLDEEIGRIERNLT